MTTVGTVRSWSADDGWGVVDSPETPGGCWTHVSHVMVAGNRTLRPGQRVELEWEPAGQDGYGYRAVRTWPAGSDPVLPDAPAGPADAYAGRLTLTPHGDPG